MVVSSFIRYYLISFRITAEANNNEILKRKAHRWVLKKFVTYIREKSRDQLGFSSKSSKVSGTMYVWRGCGGQLTSSRPKIHLRNNEIFTSGHSTEHLPHTGKYLEGYFLEMVKTKNLLTRGIWDQMKVWVLSQHSTEVSKCILNPTHLPLSSWNSGNQPFTLLWPEVESAFSGDSEKSIDKDLKILNKGPQINLPVRKLNSEV